MSDGNKLDSAPPSQIPTQSMTSGEPDEPDPSPDELEVLSGTSYRAMSTLGHGGMGAVYLAEHRDLGRVFAVKVVRPELSSTPEAMARLRREARAAVKIRHPNVVDVTDFGVTDQGRAFVVMEHLAGQTLAERLEHQGALEPAVVAWIARQVAAALAAAHEQGVIHRDVKPDNIIFTSDDDPERPSAKLVDFGLALSSEDLTARLTRHGLIFGTPEYMSPEQVRASPLTPSSDIYSFGVVLYEMLTGSVPFSEETSVETMAAKLNRPVEPPRQRAPDRPLAPPLERLVLRCLERAKDDRPETMQEIIEVLDPLVPTPTEAPPSSQPPPPTPPRWPKTLAMLAALTAAAALGGGLVFFLVSPPSRPEPSAQATLAPTTFSDTGILDAEAPRPDPTANTTDSDIDLAGEPETTPGEPEPRPPAPRQPRAPPPAALETTTAELLAEGRRLLRRRQLAQAQRAFERGARQSPSSAAVQAGLGRVAFEQGRYPAAAAHLERALRGRPSDHATRVLLGSAYLRQGRRSSAIEQWERVLAADHDNRAARRSLEAVSR